MSKLIQNKQKIPEALIPSCSFLFFAWCLMYFSELKCPSKLVPIPFSWRFWLCFATLIVLLSVLHVISYKHAFDQKLIWLEIQIIWELESNSYMIKSRFFHFTNDKTGTSVTHILSNIHSYSQSRNIQWVPTRYSLECHYEEDDKCYDSVYRWVVRRDRQQAGSKN